MDDIDLLSGFLAKKKEERKYPSEVSLEDDISDITFMLHWFPQFTLDDLLELNLRTFNALLKNGKADYLQNHIQELVGTASMYGQKGEGKDYINRLQAEIKRLRQ